MAGGLGGVAERSEGDNSRRFAPALRPEPFRQADKVVDISPFCASVQRVSRAGYLVARVFRALRSAAGSYFFCASCGKWRSHRKRMPTVVGRTPGVAGTMEAAGGQLCLPVRRKIYGNETPT